MLQNSFTLTTAKSASYFTYSEDQIQLLNLENQYDCNKLGLARCEFCDIIQGKPSCLFCQTSIDSSGYCASENIIPGPKPFRVEDCKKFWDHPICYRALHPNSFTFELALNNLFSTWNRGYPYLQLYFGKEIDDY